MITKIDRTTITKTVIKIVIGIQIPAPLLRWLPLGIRTSVKCTRGGDSEFPLMVKHKKTIRKGNINLTLVITQYSKFPVNFQFVSNIVLEWYRRKHWLYFACLVYNNFI